MWHRFHLNVGGFTVKNCHWNSASGQILFPRRYDRSGRRHKVIFVRGTQVNRLRDLLESGQMALPRDRRPCILRIHILGLTHDPPRWVIFNFTVRGFTILGCRWQPSTGSIQLPVTFFLSENPGPYGPWRRKQIVCAFGAHINRLRQAAEEEFDRIYDYHDEQAEEPVPAT